MLVSLPRDSYVPIPGRGRNKLNAAYAFGGPQLLARTVEQVTGIRLDRYMEVGFDGFASVVDAVGGVQICPGRAMRDPMAGLNVKAGCRGAWVASRPWPTSAPGPAAAAIWTGSSASRSSSAP